MNYINISFKILKDNKINSTSKLLLGLIISLSYEKGYCYATDQYLEDVLCIKKRAIQSNLYSLKQIGYINIEHLKKERRIYLNKVVKNNDEVVSVEWSKIKHNANNIISNKKCEYEKYDTDEKYYIQDIGNNEKKCVENSKIQHTETKNTAFCDEKKCVENNINNNINNKERIVYQGSSETNLKSPPSSEFSNFIKELCFVFSEYTCLTATELPQLYGFRTTSRQTGLKKLFEMRKYDWKECIEYAKREANKKPDLSKRWLDFIGYLQPALKNGDARGVISRYYTKTELEEIENKKRELQAKKDAEMKAQKNKEDAEMKAQGFDIMSVDDIINNLVDRFSFLKVSDKEGQLSYW